MLNEPLTKSERDQILARWTTAMNRYRDCVEREDVTGANRASDEADTALAQYFDRLPVVAMSTCPFTGKPLMRSFDPFGLDGPWWQPGAQRFAPTPSFTFCVLRGAVHLQGKRVIGPALEAAIGPEVPYVIPRLLALSNMTAVIGELSMSPGYKVYTIAYFADPKPPAKDLTADWPDTSYTYKTLFGEGGTVIPVDVWDFDLKPWIAKGKLRWCVPGSGNETVAPPAPRSITGAQDCPYLDLKGRREYLAVRGDQVWNRGLPNGDPITAADLLD
ncbi:MAG: hypothetical protein R3B68_13375 [Phycisphaerales bacterium]